jgi:hypothetical protein
MKVNASNAAISKATGKTGQNLWQRIFIKGDTTEIFAFDDAGAINLVSEIDLRQNVITRYTPVFNIMFDGMKPGETSEVETSVSVYDLKDPTHLKYKGRLKVTHTYVGAYELTVPAGKFETVLIRSSYVGKVGPAHVVDGGYVFYAPGVGIVASLERMHVTAFLFYDKKTKHRKYWFKRALKGYRVLAEGVSYPGSPQCDRTGPGAHKCRGRLLLFDTESGIGSFGSPPCDPQ